MIRLSTAALLCAFLLPRCVAAETVRITISDLSFLPSVVTAKVGDTIEWTNTDFVAHTATDKGEAWDLAIDAGQSASVVIAKPGIYSYFCRVHPNMTGTLHVEPK